MCSVSVSQNNFPLNRDLPKTAAMTALKSKRMAVQRKLS